MTLKEAPLHSVSIKPHIIISIIQSRCMHQLQPKGTLSSTAVKYLRLRLNINYQSNSLSTVDIEKHTRHKKLGQSPQYSWQ